MPDDKRGPAGALPVAVETGVDFIEDEAGDGGGTGSDANTLNHLITRQTQWRRRAHSRNIGPANRISIQAEINPTVGFSEAVDLFIEMLGHSRAQPRIPNDFAVVPL